MVLGDEPGYEPQVSTSNDNDDGKITYSKKTKDESSDDLKGRKEKRINWKKRKTYLMRKDNKQRKIEEEEEKAEKPCGPARSTLEMLTTRSPSSLMLATFEKDPGKSIQSALHFGEIVGRS